MTAMSEPTPPPAETTIKVSPAEIDLANAQENQAYLQGQLEWLQNRVALLRIQLNRSTEEAAQQRLLAESLQAEVTRLKQKPTRKKPAAK